DLPECCSATELELDSGKQTS
nr:RecName: Full=Putative antimicrobial protein 2 [Cenchritis muricatus]